MWVFKCMRLLENQQETMRLNLRYAKILGTCYHQAGRAFACGMAVLT